jgi:hypothetical protein
MRKHAVAVLVAVFVSLPTFAQPLPFRVELPVSAPEYAPIEDTSGWPRVATNGDGYVATWTDLRGGEPRGYAARFKQDGTRLDPFGIRIAPADYSGAVVWAGNSYLLIYGDGTKLYSRLLSTDGLLGAPTLILDLGFDAAIPIDAASNGTNILVVTGASPGLLLDLQGNKLREVAFPWESVFRGIDVATAGGKYLVVAGNSNANAITVASDGTTGALRVLGPIAVQSNISVATDGAKFLAVWSRDNVEAQSFDANGNLLGAIRTLTTNGGVIAPAVGARDGEYFVTFAEEYTRSIYGLRVSLDGVAIAQPQRTTSKSIVPAAIESIGTSGVALWRSDRGGLEAAFFDPASITEPDPFRTILPFAEAAQKQFDIRLARLANGGVVAGWIEKTATRSELRLSRGPGSVPYDAAHPGASAERLIDVLVEGGVVWAITASSGSIDAQRFTEALEPIDELPVRIVSQTHSNAGFSVAASGGGTAMVVYQAPDASPNPLSDMKAVLLRNGGASIETRTIDLTSGAFEDHHPAVVFDDDIDNYIVAWARAKGQPATDIGQVEPADQIVETMIPIDGFIFPFLPRVTFNGSSPVRALFGAQGARGTAFVWQTAEDIAPMMRYAGELAAQEQARALDINDSATIAAFEPHGDGFVLVAATNTFARKFYLQEIEVLTIGALGGFGSTTKVGTFEAHNEWRAPDLDILGGAFPVFAYARLASDAEYGGVSRIFIQQSTSGRRRAVR